MSSSDKPTTRQLRKVILSMADAFDSELFAESREQLEAHWYFKFDATKTLEHNIYEFHDLLKLYSSSCRRWEEHHNGSCCVVERVRDQYMWPKIKQFATDIKAQAAAEIRREAGEVKT